jgi:CBS domain-containing membrane protein
MDCACMAARAASALDLVVPVARITHGPLRALAHLLKEPAAAGPTAGTQERTMFSKRKVADVMTRDVLTLYEESSLQQVLSALGPYRFRHLPVVDGKRVVGIISQRDLLLLSTQGLGHGPASQAREARLMEEVFLRDVMTTQVVTIEPEATLAEAGRRMLESRIGALPVVDRDGELVGIVTENDLLRSFVQAA